MVQFKKYKTKNGETRYQFQTYLGKDPQTGKDKVTRRRGFKTKSEAQITYSRLKVEFDNKGKIEKITNITFKQLYEEWLPVYRSTVRESTFSTTRYIFNKRILPEFEDKFIQKITSQYCQKILLKWYESGFKTYRRWFFYLKKIFDFAKKQEYIKKNPCAELTLPRSSDSFNKPSKYWTKEELIKFFDCIDKVKQPEMYTYFRLLAFTGIRKGESLALVWSDVDFKNSTINITKTLTQGMRGKKIVQPPKTRASKRIIPLDKKTLATLSQWKEQQAQWYNFLNVDLKSNDKQLIFANKVNSFLSLYTPGEWLNDIIKENHLKKITVHGLRHTHASLLYASGVNVKEAQKRLGHSDLATTMQIYTHISEQQERKVVDQLTNYIDY